MSGILKPRPPVQTIKRQNASGGALPGGTAVILTAADGFDHPAAGAGADAVLIYDSDAVGDLMALALPGQAVEGLSSAAFAEGARLAADAVGKFATATVGQHVIAKAMRAAGGADELVPIVFIGGHPVEPA